MGEDAVKLCVEWWPSQRYWSQSAFKQLRDKQRRKLFLSIFNHSPPWKAHNVYFALGVKALPS